MVMPASKSLKPLARRARGHRRGRRRRHPRGLRVGVGPAAAPGFDANTGPRHPACMMVGIAVSISRGQCAAVFHFNDLIMAEGPAMLHVLCCGNSGKTFCSQWLPRSQNPEKKLSTSRRLRGCEAEAVVVLCSM